MARNIYQYAAKNKLRFPFKGNISIEELYDLNLTALDTVFKNLSKQVKSNEGESLLVTKSKEDTDIQIKMEIVREIFAEKQAAINAAQKAAETKAKNQKIMSIIARKEDEELNNKSVDELKAMLESNDIETSDESDESTDPIDTDM